MKPMMQVIEEHVKGVNLDIIVTCSRSWIFKQQLHKKGHIDKVILLKFYSGLKGDQ